MARQKGLSALQQAFLSHLLTGKTIRQAALLSDVSLRAAMYWLADGPVRVEYDKKRAIALADFDERVSNIHNKALDALEDILAAETPPFIRIQAVRMVYENHLRESMDRRYPQSPTHMLLTEVDDYYDMTSPEKRLGVYLYDDRGKPRIND